MRLTLLAAVIVTLLLPTMARADTAVFAGGCFWCMESEFQDHKGISDVVSGFAGGPNRDANPPTYEDVSGGDTGFKESVQVTYDPNAVSYQDLLDIFWRNVDPFDDKGQFCDKGTQYIAAIFYGSPAEEKLARASVDKVENKFGEKVATQILPKTTFYPAEEYHQDFYKKSSTHYKLYRAGCGRDSTLKKIWEDKKN